MVEILTSRVLWSQELSSEIFNSFFFTYDFGGEGPNSAGPNSRMSTVARDARMKGNLAPRKCNLITKNDL